MSTLPRQPPRDGDAVKAALTAVYNWNYEPEIDQLRTLYANGLERQWIAVRDLDWDAGIDREAFTRTFSMGGIPVSETAFWKSLPLETRWTVSRTSAAYIALLEEIHEISPGLKDLLDAVLAAPEWTSKAVGMQVVTEGLALYFFRDLRNQTREPLLKQLLTYVSRDEARHTGYGIKYLGQVVPTLSDGARGELEDFAFETTRMLMASRAGNTMRDRVMATWQAAGVDPGDAMRELEKERDLIAEQLARTGGRYGPVSGFIIPTLRAIGLYSERLAGRFLQMWTETQGRAAAERYAGSDAELPDDLERWVEEGAAEP